MLKLLNESLKPLSIFIYSESLRKINDDLYIFVAKIKDLKNIGIVKQNQILYFSSPYFSEDKKIEGTNFLVNLYPLNFENYQKLKEIIPISPKVCDKKISFGTGDRLGLITSAQLSALKEYDLFPILAQQSPRELIKTKRDFKDVLLKSAMGVLETGYTGKYGADADHIKDEKYLIEAIDAGYTMYTLDISDFIEKIKDLSEKALKEKYEKVSSFSKKIIDKYAGKRVKISDEEYFELSYNELCKSAIVYEKALSFVEMVYEILKSKLSEFDIEVSIDEGERDTTPEDHFFVAQFLHDKGIDFKSLAPKFPGEFQKGIDYIGDIKEFERALKKHYALTKALEGYRLSLHSGSDKFSIYKIFYKITEGNFHIKTSGTSWLEAVKVIAKFFPDLFVELYQIALENLEESKKAYKVNITKEEFPKEIKEDYMEFLHKDNVRQLFHISYGVLLDEKRKEIYDLLNQKEKEHYQYVSENIKKHLKNLFEEE
ncbi:MAG: tagaturonate epimerase family protein [Dictyoglomus sp.]